MHATNKPFNIDKKLVYEAERVVQPPFRLVLVFFKAGATVRMLVVERAKHLWQSSLSLRFTAQVTQSIMPPTGRAQTCWDPSCPFRRLRSFRFLRPARLRTPLLGYGAPHLSARGTSTLLNNALLSEHFRTSGWPTFRHK
jgi:hypothetical protein